MNSHTQININALAANGLYKSRDSSKMWLRLKS